MEPIIPTWMIYLISTLSSFRVILSLFVALGGFASGAYFTSGWIDKGDAYDESSKQYIRGTRKTYIATKLSKLTIIAGIVLCFIPPEKTMYAMFASSYLTPNNIESFTDGAKGVIDYIFSKIELLR